MLHTIFIKYSKIVVPFTPYVNHPWSIFAVKPEAAKCLFSGVMKGENYTWNVFYSSFYFFSCGNIKKTNNAIYHGG